MRTRRAVWLAGWIGLTLLAGPASRPASGEESGTAVELSTLTEELRAAETAFAATMAHRDHAGFVSFLAEESIFIGGQRALRGRTGVADGWKRFFEGETAPFSWRPALVEVLDSGTLGLTSGPVLDPSGRDIGVFNSVWRRENGAWKVVFDKGCPPCECP